ncbi:hypothetical protein ACIQHS_19580, partial [Pseudarthrobacter oxydans]
MAIGGLLETGQAWRRPDLSVTRRSPAAGTPVDSVAPPVPGVLSVADVSRSLSSVPVASTGPGMIDQLRELEDLKSLVAAKQARIAVAFDLSQRREQAAAGVPAKERGAGVAAQVALARRESPARGGRRGCQVFCVRDRSVIRSAGWSDRKSVGELNGES